MAAERRPLRLTRSAVVVIDDDDNSDDGHVLTSQADNGKDSRSHNRDETAQLRSNGESGSRMSTNKRGALFYDQMKPTSVRRSRPMSRQRAPPASDEKDNINEAARETVIVSDSASHATDNIKHRPVGKASGAAQSAPKRIKKAVENDEPTSTTTKRSSSAKTSKSKAVPKQSKSKSNGRSSPSKTAASADRSNTVQVMPAAVEEDGGTQDEGGYKRRAPATVEVDIRSYHGSAAKITQSISSVQSSDSDVVEVKRSAAAGAPDSAALSVDSEPKSGRLLKKDKRTLLRQTAPSLSSETSFSKRLAQDSTKQLSQQISGKVRSSASTSIPLADDRFGSDAEDRADDSDEISSPQTYCSPKQNEKDALRAKSARRKLQRRLTQPVAESSASAGNDEHDEDEADFVVAGDEPISAHECQEDVHVRSESVMDDDAPHRARANTSRLNERRQERAERLERLRVQREETALSRSQFVEPAVCTTPNKSLPIFDPPTTPSRKGRLNTRFEDGKHIGKHPVADFDEDVAKFEPASSRPGESPRARNSGSHRAAPRPGPEVNDSDNDLPRTDKSTTRIRSSAAIVLSDENGDDVQVLRRRPKRSSGRPSSIYDREEDEEPRQRKIIKRGRPSSDSSNSTLNSDEEAVSWKLNIGKKLKRARETKSSSTGSSSSSSSSSARHPHENAHSDDEVSEDELENLKLDFDHIKEDKLRPVNDKKDHRLDAYKHKRAWQQQRKEKLSKGIIISDNEDVDNQTTVISDGELTEEDVDAAGSYESDQDDVGNFIEHDGKMTEEQRDEVEASMPVEFTRHGKLELDDHVRYFIHYLVHSFYMRNSKRFRKDPMYRNYEYSIQQIRRKIDGVVDSAIASSIWRSEFRAALDERPELELTQISYLQGCQGCNRTDRTASQRAVLYGKRYDPETWEEDEETDSASDGDGITFDLGRFCGTRCSFHHALRHFMYNVAREVRNLCQRPENMPRQLPENRNDKYEQLTAFAVAVCKTLEHHNHRIFNHSFVEEKYIRLLDVIDAAKKAYVDGQ